MLCLLKRWPGYSEITISLCKNILHYKRQYKRWTANSMSKVPLYHFIFTSHTGDYKWTPQRMYPLTTNFRNSFPIIRQFIRNTVFPIFAFPYLFFDDLIEFWNLIFHVYWKTTTMHLEHGSHQPKYRRIISYDHSKVKESYTIFKWKRMIYNC